jgi:NhaP-type Na+/H+ or K+/H+ antiporter
MTRHCLRFLAGCWMFLLVGLWAAVLYPRILTWIPHRELLKPLLIVLLTLSVICPLAHLYREGIKSSRKSG